MVATRVGNGAVSVPGGQVPGLVSRIKVCAAL